MKTEWKLIICFFCLSLSAVPVWAGEPNLADCDLRARAACEAITIFVTGNGLGELRPCGCSGGQLGGFDRRATLLKAVDTQQRFILDTGNLIKNGTAQSLIKLDIIMQAFTMLGYDVVNLTKQDMAYAGHIGEVPFELIAVQDDLPQVFSRQMQLGGKPVTVMVTAAADDDASIEKVVSEFVNTGETPAPLKIVVFDGSDKAAERYLADLEIADVVIVQADSDEAALLKKTDKGTLVVSTGRLGKYVGRLDVRNAKEGEGFELTYKGLGITENLAQEPNFIALYKTYQAIVKDQKLLEKHPKYALPNNLQYVGSRACGIKGCHDYEYNTAIVQKHEHALETLVKVDSDNDPECVICHVVGMDYKNGFLTEQTTPELKGVGCETCHGPGSEHLVTAGKAKTVAPKQKCVDCHTIENSLNYAGREQEYCEKIYHWREPNVVDCVQY